jgi:hypothetical protein
MSRYSIFSLVRNGLSHHQNCERQWRSPEPMKEYDVVIAGGFHDHKHHERQPVRFSLELRYLLKSIVKNIGHFQEVIKKLLDRNLGIEKYFSYIVIRSLFFKQTMRLDKLLSDDDSEERAR